MVTIIRFFVHEPLLGGVVLLCLLLVGGLMLSDWAEKRRTRVLLQARETARRAQLGLLEPLTARVPATSAEVPKQAFQLFRWQYVVIAVLLGIFVLPKMRESAEVEAKTRARSDSSAEMRGAQPHDEAMEVAAAHVPAVATNASVFLFPTRMGLSVSKREAFSLDLTAPSETEVDIESLFRLESPDDLAGFTESSYSEIRGGNRMNFSSLESGGIR